MLCHWFEVKRLRAKNIEIYTNIQLRRRDLDIKYYLSLLYAASVHKSGKFFKFSFSLYFSLCRSSQFLLLTLETCSTTPKVFVTLQMIAIQWLLPLIYFHYFQWLNKHEIRRKKNCRIVKEKKQQFWNSLQ